MSGAIALVVLAAVVIVGIVARGGSDSEPVDASLTAPLAADQGGDWVLDPPPTAYRIVYLSEDYASTGTVTTTNEFTVRRPFQSLRVTKSGAPPGGDVQITSIHDFATFSRLDAGSDADSSTTTPTSAPASTQAEATTTTVAEAPKPYVYQYTPQFASGDVRLDATLPDLLAGQYFERLERRTLLGRDCQVYRTGQALETSVLSKPSDVAYALACIDRMGLILEEVVVENGRVARHITATEVHTAIDPQDGDFAITGDPAPIEEGALDVTSLALDAPPAPTYWVLDTLPAGFSHTSRFELTAAQLDSTGSASKAEDGSVTTIVGYADVFRAGVDAIVVVQGPPALQSLQIAVDGPTVRVGGLGTAQVAANPSGSRLMATPANPGNWAVRIDATMSVDALTSLAKTMHTVAGPAPTTTTSTTTAPATTAATNTSAT